MSSSAVPAARRGKKRRRRRGRQKRRAAASTSAEARDAYLKDAEGLLLDTANVIPIYGRRQPYQLREDVLGVCEDGMGAWYFGMARKAVK